MINYTFKLLNSNDYLTIIMVATLYFSVIYFVFTSFSYWLARAIKQPISHKPVSKHQIRTEVTQSLRSIAIFSAGILVPWGMIKTGLAGITLETSTMRIISDCIMLIIWNDLHFYIIHRVLHAKFKKAHGVHHQSVTSTSFAAYSISITEALLLGSVMPLAMLVYTFSLEALLLLPIWSIFINTLSHSNCDLFPKANPYSLLGFIKHHQHHHSHYSGNYSFFFGQLDIWLGTAQISTPTSTQAKSHDAV